jgi:hypothetical protein
MFEKFLISDLFIILSGVIFFYLIFKNPKHEKEKEIKRG